MQDDRGADWAAIERVLSGDASPEERQQVREWAAGDAENAALYAQLEMAWRSAAQDGRRYDSDAAWQRVRAQLHDDAVVRRAAPRRGISRTAMRWAAILAVVAGGSAVVRLAGPLALEESPLIAAQVSTGVGQLATVRLGDGTVVTLGPQSTIAEADGGRERRVDLTGNAHFDVVRDERRPFVVLVGAAETRVLGTSFSVRGYGGESPLEVVVESGRVSVRANRQQEAVVLNAGQLVTVAPDGSVDVRSDVDVAARLSWRNRRLSFEREPLRLVAAELERWYGIEVSITDSHIGEFPLTATFAGAEIAHVLTVTSRSLGIRHSFDGQTAEFRP